MEAARGLLLRSGLPLAFLRGILWLSTTGVADVAAWYDAAMRRYVRIAVTALSLTACVLLIALWVRSYWWADEVTLASRLMFGSSNGCVRYHVLFAPYSFTDDWNYSCWSIPDWVSGGSRLEVAKHNLFFLMPQSISRPGFVPYWFFTLPPFTLTLVQIRRLKWRFSLRTLLIATTLVAVVLRIMIGTRY
jgi:hypothetical protein